MISIESTPIKAERNILIYLLIAISILTTLDIFQDLSEGTTLSHASIEILVVGFAVFGAFYLWTKTSRSWLHEREALEIKLTKAKEDSSKWKAKASMYIEGLSKAIEEQLSDWGLSQAEKDVGFLLIKGLSLKEIAEARKSSESTVRQQAATVYRKSGLDGRAQLSAFFLEDLFVPDSKGLAVSLK